MANKENLRGALNNLRNKNPREIKTSAPAAAPQANQTAPVTERKKAGRPKVKTEPCKTINIAVPVSVLEQIEIAKAKHHNNLTEYVNAVIAKDLKQNMTEYQKIYDLLNN